MALVAAGRVRVNGAGVRDPERPVVPGRDRIEVDGQPVVAAAAVYLMLNKPRGLVTTAADERGRDTVFRCLADAGLPFVSPVGRLDQASETCFNRRMNRRRTHRVRGKGWLCASSFGPEQADIFRRDLLPDCFLANTLFNANAVDTPRRVGAHRHPEGKTAGPG